MKEKILLSVMLMLTWVGTVKADGEGQGQQQKLTVFENNDWTNTDLPVNGEYAHWYQKCELIYPADYLKDMKNNNISRMAFHTGSNKASWEATFKIYLKEVAQSSFPTENLSFTDFSDVDPVYTGQLDATGDTVWVVFDKPFYYQGGNLLVVLHLTEPGNYDGAKFQSKKNMSRACIRGRNKESFDAVKPLCVDYLPKVTFCYSPAEQGLVAPSAINVTCETLNSAKIEWQSGASAWQIYVKDVEEDKEYLINTSYKPYTLTKLDKDHSLKTDHFYEIKVRAVNGDKVSDWSNTFGFRTLYCTKDQEVEIRYELHYIGPSRYYPGWKGNAIIVKDAITGVQLAEWKNDNGWDASGTLKVCLGRKIRFEWKEGDDVNYPPEDCSYTVYDHYGEEIFSGKGNSFFPVYHTVFSGIIAPVDLTVSNIGTNSATIGWTERGDEEVKRWQLCISDVEDDLEIVDSNPFTLTGLKYDTNYWVMVRTYKDDDNKSEWSEPITFTTAEICPKPKNLRSEPEATEATLSWEGTLDIDSYVLQYNAWWKWSDDINPANSKTTYTFDLQPFKGTGSIAIRHYNVPDHSWLHIDNIEVTNAEGERVYFEDFENSRGRIPAQLSSIDHDGDGYGWEVLSNKPEDQWLPYDQSGVYGISSTTWKKDGRELHPDDWLIISDVELGGTFSFMGLAQRIDETDNFAVYVMADDYVKEVPISNSNSYYMSRLLNNVPYSWRIKSVRGAEESRWASALFETPYDPHAIATGIKAMDNGQWTMDNYAEEWYTIEGQKLSGKPTKKGVYIYNGKRVVN
jgi:hypothetical protein